MGRLRKYLGIRPKIDDPPQTPILSPVPTPSVAPTATNNPDVVADSGHVQTKARQSSPAELNSAPRSLWDQAYDILHQSDPKLVDDYEALLSKELPGTSNGSDGELETRRSRRQEQLTAVTARALQRLDDKKTKYTIFGHEYVLRDQVTASTGLILKLKDNLSEAIKASPQASVAWASVCILLPLLTNPAVAEAANRSGFTYVMSRTQYYVGLEQVLWPTKATLAPDLKGELQGSIVRLYRQILEFQLKSVLRFYRGWLAKLNKDALQYDDWEGMLGAIQKSEASLRDDLRQINDLVSLGELEELSETADKMYESTKALLSVSEQQLHVSEESRDYLGGIRSDVQNISQLLSATHDVDQAPIDIPIVLDACYDSADVQDEPKCLDGTRTSFRKRTMDWLDDKGAHHILWLAGPAGTGKSTLTRTLTDVFASQKRLAAGYFFRRGRQERNGTARLFATLAIQMAETIPLFKPLLRRSVCGLKPEAIEKSSLEKQFNTMILNPLVELEAAQKSAPSWVIVIDALDECEDQHRLPSIFELLSRLNQLQGLRVYILLTSRRTSSIEDAFEHLARKGTPYLTFRLHEENPEEAKADVEVYLRTEFASIKAKERVDKGPWPSPADMEDIIELATVPSPLFIYASTLCLFVKDNRKGKTPRRQLEYWLRQSDRRAPRLAQIYLPILQESFGLDLASSTASEWDEDLLDMRRLLITLVYALAPLSVMALAGLLDFDENTVVSWLRDMQAILNVPDDRFSPVKFLHKSFNDFMRESDDATLGHLSTEASETHAMLMERCFWRMGSNGLVKDICDIRSPDREAESIDRQTVSEHIPSDLEYACLFWTQHLCQGGSIVTRAADADAFLRTHLLHWLEALSLLRKTAEAVTSIRRLKEGLQASASQLPASALSFVEEILNFILSFISTIRIAPLQAYAAALVFCPGASQLWQTYWSQRLTCVRDVHSVERRFASQAINIEPGDRACDMTFSPCGKFIAATLYHHKTVTLWDARSGALIQTLPPLSRTPLSVAFSPNGRFVSCQTNVGTVYIWSVGTGILKHVFHDDGIQVHDDNATPRRDQPVRYLSTKNLQFSPDGTLLGFASRDGGLRLWSVDSGTLHQTIEGRGGQTMQLEFSADGTLVAALAETTGRHNFYLRKDIGVWSVATGSLVHVMSARELYRPLRQCPHAPHDTFGRRKGRDAAAKSSNDESIEDSEEISDSEHTCSHCRDDSRLDVLDCHLFTFSADSRMLMFVGSSISPPCTFVQRWDVATGEFKPPVLISESRARGSAVVSPYFNSIVVGIITAGNLTEKAGRLCLWDSETGAVRTNSSHVWDPFKRLTLSPDGHSMSIFDDGAIQIYDTINDISQQDVDDHVRGVHVIRMSPDGNRAMSGSYDATLRLWNTRTGQLEHVLRGHKRAVNDVGFSSDGTRAVSCSEDATAIVWSVATGLAELTLLLGDGYPLALNCFSPDGEMVAAASHSMLCVWDSSSGSIKHTLKDLVGIPEAIAFSPDSKTVAVFYRYPSELHLWHVASGVTLQMEHGDSLVQTWDTTDRLVAHADIGLFILEGRSPQDTTGLGCHRNRRWITMDGEKVLRVPPDHRVTSSSSSGNTIALGHDSGRVTFIDFAGSAGTTA